MEPDPLSSTSKAMTKGKGRGNEKEEEEEGRERKEMEGEGMSCEFCLSQILKVSAVPGGAPISDK